VEEMICKTNIDEIDAKIIKTLLSESRTSFSKIAKDCKISVAAVRMRYKHLWKIGIINGETMLVNPYALGYSYICLIGMVVNAENEQKAIDFLASKPYIPIVFKNFGKYSLGTQVALRNIDKLSKMQQDLEESQLIKHVDSLILVDDMIIEHPENLIVKPFNGRIEPESKVMEKKGPNVQLDEIDRKIAKILTQKSRTSFRKIAAQLGTSPKRVIERYKKLRENLLTLSTITVDLNKLGYSAGAYLFIKLANKGTTSEVATELLKTPNLIVLVKYIGIYDLFAHVVFEDFQQYFKIVENIKKIQNIEQLDIFLTPNFPAWPLNRFASLL
jgi:Lrp/AsnC family transcriptional regulator for asnA, asnC and gidA